jgi:hypothetical protein
MPLAKKAPQAEAPTAQAAAPKPLASAQAATPAPEATAQTATQPRRLGGTRMAGTKAEAPMTKEGYWDRKEARDIETGIRIRRSGVWQAALQSTGLLQLNTGNTLQDFLALVEKTADAGLAYVNKE